jgi:sulfate adenylyltransferase subunit 1
VQWVNRPHRPSDPALHDFRGFSGQIAAGRVRCGEEVWVLPAGHPTRIKAIHGVDGPQTEAFCPQSVTLELEHDLDVSRGNLIAGRQQLPGMSVDLEADVCWMHPRALTPGRKFLLKHGTATVQALVSEVLDRLDLASFDRQPGPDALALNDIGRIRVRTAQPLVYDGYATNRATGSFVLIEPGTHATVAAGMLAPPHEAVRPDLADYTI